MSVEALAVVLHHSRATGTDKLVLLGVANHAGDGGAWPAVSTLARYANVTERNVQKALRRLVELGELRVHLQDGGRHNTPSYERPNRYDVLVSCPSTCDGTTQHRERRLPQAPADLWINPLSPATPPVASDTRPLSPATPHPLSPATPEPSTQHTQLPTVSSSVTGPREDDAARHTPPCAECSAPHMAACYARQARLALDDRHTYTAVSYR